MDAIYENLTINAFNGLKKCNGFSYNYTHSTHSTSHNRNHTLDITHWISHTGQHTLDITHSPSHTLHHTLDITHSLQQNVVRGVKEWLCYTPHTFLALHVTFNAFNVLNGLVLVFFLQCPTMILKSYFVQFF